MKRLGLYGDPQEAVRPGVPAGCGHPAEGIHAPGASGCRVPGLPPRACPGRLPRGRGEGGSGRGGLRPCWPVRGYQDRAGRRGRTRAPSSSSWGQCWRWWGRSTGCPGSPISASLMAGGVAQMLAESPKGMFNPSTTTSDIETFTFNLPTATTGQGAVCPSLYGQHRVSGHAISAGIDAQTCRTRALAGPRRTTQGRWGQRRHVPLGLGPSRRGGACREFCSLEDGWDGSGGDTGAGGSDTGTTPVTHSDPVTPGDRNAPDAVVRGRGPRPGERAEVCFPRQHADSEQRRVDEL